MYLFPEAIEFIRRPPRALLYRFLPHLFLPLRLLGSSDIAIRDPLVNQQPPAP